MSISIEKILNAALRKIIRPLARILLRNGIAYGSFSEIAKRVFVEVAFDDFSESGKKQTVSRVSAITGLTRKEVSRIRDTEADTDHEASQRYNRAIRVISGWLNDPEYLDDTGAPLHLPINSGAPSFASLVKTYSGDIPTMAMLNVLLAAGSVEKKGANLALVSSAYIPSDDPADKINILGTDVQEMITTIDHNLTAEKKDRRFQRKVSYSGITEDIAREFQLHSTARSQALLEEFNEWLYEKERAQPPTAVKENNKYLSVGIYFYECEDQGEEP